MIVTRLKEKRDRTEQPRTIWAERGPNINDPLGDKHTFGCTYADGTRERLFEIDLRSYMEDYGRIPPDELLAALQLFKIDMAAIERSAREDLERKRREEMENIRKRAWDAMREQMERMAFGFTDTSASWNGYQAFEDRDFGRFNDRKADPYDIASIRRDQARYAKPERKAALDKCRKLKRLADSSTFAGERDNANARRRELMAKHAIEEREL